MFCTVLRKNSDCFPIKHGRSTFFWQRTTIVIADWFAGRKWEKKSVTGIPNRLNGRGICIIYAYFTNVTTGSVMKHELSGYCNRDGE